MKSRKMRKAEYKDIMWSKNNAYYKSKYVGGVVKDSELKGMYRYKHINGAESVDYYNKSRAMDNFTKQFVLLWNETLDLQKTGVSEPVG